MFARTSLRTAARTSLAARRPLSSTSARFANPATTSDVGTTGGSGDATTAEAKNSLYPVFMAIGVASIAYLGYSNISQRKADNKANKEAPYDEQTTKRPLGDTAKTSSRG
ncbi:uncharacterized protein JCM6883_004009 [Sporobolomyces salmoneus]|uniref:uncharacterized protein n=1 Tax=Sporobolomyces salmoneus TaxID=183962 RepID=UPI00316FC114